MAAAVLLPFTLSLAVGELVCRVLIPDRQLRYQTDPDVLFRLEPDQVGFLPMADGRPTPEMRINELGFRGPAVQLPPIRRIVVLGDSFTFGFGVEDHETFAARLDQALGTSIQVLNAGQPGYGVFQMAEMLDRIAPLRPEVVIVTLWQGDFLRRPPTPTEKRSLFGRARALAFLKQSVLLTHLYRRFERAMLRLGAERLVVRVGDFGVRAEGADLVELYRSGVRSDLASLRRMNEHARTWGASLVVVLWPKEGFAEGAAPGLAGHLTGELAGFADEHGIPFLSLQEVLAAAPLERLTIPHDSHPTAYAHCLVAGFLSEYLLSLGIGADPIECGRD